ncbi:nucleotidyltransferase family protein [Rhodovulum sp. 12E13]|uniref:nucleotidyltransferase family protein n=1 Tax=Rhodovulum sp. 12E13 TaxID=2203891 RepID=UPI000E18DC59|nr:nucleotidyltransferase family protein [Rhodovulum sp. 12E13]RDC72736.1 nucleotidyltransferase family protein [Rhodovulum sp. 12E13]
MSVAAVVLAAGLSTRFGAGNKLLAEVGGRPLLLRTLDAVLGATTAPPLVVLGHQAEAVGARLGGLPVDLATNPEHAAGQQGSVAFGLARVADADLTLVVPGDLPRLTASALFNLLSAARTAPPGRVTVPMRGRVRGNPVVLSRQARAAVLAGGPRLGCGGFTRRNPGLVHRFETDLPAFFADVDTADDLARVRDEMADAAR